MKQKPHTGSLPKAVIFCFWFNPMRGMITVISNSVFTEILTSVI